MPSSDVSDAPVLGAQRPRIECLPAGVVYSAGADVVALCQEMDFELDPWQQYVLEHALGEREDGRWAAFEVGLPVPRQNGKSGIIEARILAGLFLFEEELIVYSAHEFKTAKEIMRRVEYHLQKSGKKYKPNRSHGEEGFELPADDDHPRARRVMFQSRTKAGGRGLSGDCVILDEAMIIKPEAVGTLMPTMAARPNPQIWYAGSAVDQEIHPHGFIFSAIRHRGVEGGKTPGVEPRLCFMEWSAEKGAKRSDPRVQAQANPAVGFRITLEYIADELRAMQHTPHIFDVERLGIGDWPQMTDAALRPIATQVWSDQADPAPALQGPCPLVLAVHRDGNMWSIGGAQWTTNGTAHIEIGWSGHGGPTVIAERLVRIAADANPAALVLDPHGPANILLPHLANLGIEATQANSGEVAIACDGLLSALNDGRTTHSGQPILDGSALPALKKDLPGKRFVWEAPPGGSVLHVMSASLAHWGLLMFGKPAKKSPPPLADRQETATNSGFEREFDPMTAGF
ncbi:phage terminase, large subunit, putative [Mycobacteroides abscessus subsp. abscessus]|nr:phage terminase, large subunit, putative [Mycobacteroides abscessus subsp. abscessus]SKU57790.1 phage terminase, large subunit, putative [Mycobacteroides abscessus subsp. abscessus]